MTVSIIRSGTLFGLATLVLSAGLTIGLARPADATPRPPSITCPQVSSMVGLPVASGPLVASVPGETTTISVVGALPDGLEATDRIAGVPRTKQTSTFTVTAKATASDGTMSSSSTDCTMTVTAPPPVTRIAGTDRYDQSVQMSKWMYTGGSRPNIVYIASGEKFADALSASSVAAAHRSPVLLTPASALTPGVVDEVRRLMPLHIAIVGGPLSVSDAVIDQLVAAGVNSSAIERISGADRYAVSRNLIASPLFGIAESTAVFMATGATFPDALSASPAANYLSSPVLLVDGSEPALTDAENAVVKHLGATRVFLVGGPASLSIPLETNLGLSYRTTRFGGNDRFAVSRAVNEAVLPRAGVEFVASGTVFPDALSGGAIAGIYGAPLIITQRDCLSRDPAIHLGASGAGSVILLGGSATVGTGVESLSVCPATVGS